MRLWNLDMGEHQVLREKYTGLVSGGKDRTIGILDLDTGEHQVLKRHHFR
jgi:hypothetical protein